MNRDGPRHVGSSDSPLSVSKEVNIVFDTLRLLGVVPLNVDKVGEASDLEITEVKDHASPSKQRGDDMSPASRL